MNSELRFKPRLKRNLSESFFTILSGVFALIAILPLIFVIAYVIVKGGSQINWDVLTLEPQPPGDDLQNAGGIGNAIVGTFIISTIASLISIPIGIGGGVYLAEYSKGGSFSKFIRFGTNVLAGVPSIIAGVFVYAVIVVTKVIMGSMFSGIAGGIALSILMLPTVIKTTDEGLKLVSDDLRKASLGVGASMFTTIIKITLPAALKSIATGVVLGLARAAGETAPLIFTALFSYYHINGINDIFYEMSSLSVLIYNFALEPYKAQNELAWAASFILVILLLAMNILSKYISNLASKN
tara:strand:- start:12090 stop:12980 length:891 start_codon:yes stop_codon:yes gene_type:complete